MHALVRLHPDQQVSKVMQLIKGESSHWVNSLQLSPFKFEWQDEYMALSLHNTALERVRKYIRYQEVHHRRRTAAEEWQAVLAEAGISGGVETPPSGGE